MKQAILAVSFGTSYPDTLENTIAATEQALAGAFPDWEVRRAFTSGMIIRKLRQRDGLRIDDVNQAMHRLEEEGFTHVAVQSTHVMHGEEYEKMLAQLEPYHTRLHVAVGMPLLHAESDYAAVADAMLDWLPQPGADEALVFMGHGTPRANNAAHRYTYVKLQQLFDERKANVLVGTVEDEDAPNFATVLARLQERGYQHVHLYPLMVVAGDHANNDMYSDEPDSWKSQIEALGVTTTGHLNGIGRFAAIQALYIQHALEALKI